MEPRVVLIFVTGLGEAVKIPSVSAQKTEENRKEVKKVRLVVI
jgi:hypothetical protein